MSYTELLRRGIIEENWELITKAYTGMTGDKLELLVNEDEEEDEVVSKPVRRKTAKKRSVEEETGQTTTGIRNRPRRQQVRPERGVNLFVDVEGEERAKARQAAGEVVKVIPKKKRAVDRSTALKKVKCVECGEISKVRGDIISKDSSFTCTECILEKVDK